MTESEADWLGKAVGLLLFCTPTQSLRIRDHGSLGLTRMTESEADWLQALIRAARAIRGLRDVRFAAEGQR